MNKLFSIEKPYLLIGEGKDEENLFTAMVKHLGLIETVQITQYGGKNNLADFLSSLPALTGFPNLKAIGVTRDADDVYRSASDSVRTAIEQANFPAHLHIKTFILPDEKSAGALETLVLHAVAETRVWPCIEAFTNCVSREMTEPFSKTDRAKHQLQAWLSTLSRPGRRLGEAASAGDIPFDHPVLCPIVNFIRSLVDTNRA